MRASRRRRSRRGGGANSPRTRPRARPSERPQAASPTARASPGKVRSRRCGGPRRWPRCCALRRGWGFPGRTAGSRRPPRVVRRSLGTGRGRSPGRWRGRSQRLAPPARGKEPASGWRPEHSASLRPSRARFPTRAACRRFPTAFPLAHRRVAGPAQPPRRSGTERTAEPGTSTERPPRPPTSWSRRARQGTPAQSRRRCSRDASRTGSAALRPQRNRALPGRRPPPAPARRATVPIPRGGRGTATPRATGDRPSRPGAPARSSRTAAGLLRRSR